MPLGNDLKAKLEDAIVYNRVDNNGHDNDLVVKLAIDLPTFNKLTRNAAEIDSSWLSSLIAKFDSTYDPSKALTLISRTIKDSVYDSKSVTIVMVKYKQGV